MTSGHKHYTTNGTGWDMKGCHLYTVVCRTDPEAGADDALAVIAVPGGGYDSMLTAHGDIPPWE